MGSYCRNMFEIGFYVVKYIDLNHSKIINEIKKLEYQRGYDEPIFKTMVSKSSDVLQKIPSGKIIKKELNKWVQESIDKYFGFDAKHKIESSFAICRPNNSTSDFYTHRGSFLTGIYFLDGEDDEDNYISFLYDEEPNPFNLPLRIQNPRNSSMFYEHVQKGRMVLFKSNLKHRLGYNKCGKNRHCILFNISPLINNS